MPTVSDYRRSVNTKLSALAVARHRLRDERKGLLQAEDREAALREAQSLAQTVAAAVQEEAHAKLADIVTRSLAAVFDVPYVFKIRFETKRGRTEAVLAFERGGLEVDPMTAAGGGVVDVAAFALRISCLLISRPPLRRLLVVDEPMKMLSKEYSERVRELILMLAQELDIQFIIVTHNPELACGTVIRL